MSSSNCLAGRPRVPIRGPTLCNANRKESKSMVRNVRGGWLKKKERSNFVNTHTAHVSQMKAEQIPKARRDTIDDQTPMQLPPTSTLRHCVDALTGNREPWLANDAKHE